MIKLAIYDKPASKTFSGLKQVIFIGNYEKDNGFHGTATNWVAQEIYRKYGQGLNIQQYAYSNYHNSFNDFLDWAINNKIDILSISWTLIKSIDRDLALQKALDNGIIIIASAGNDGADDEKISWPARDPRVVAVGAWDKKRNTIAGYSSWGADVYITAQGNWQIPIASGSLVDVSGTSFSTPEIAMYASIWKAITNGTREEFMEFLKENAKDVMTPGRDNATGWGLFTWSKELNFLKEKKNMEIKMTIGSKKYYVNGNEKYMDTVPILNEDNRTLVPIRFIVEALGCNVEWDNITQTVIITKE